MTALKMSNRVILPALFLAKNCLENNLAIGLDTDLKRGANLIDLTIIFINL